MTPDDLFQKQQPRLGERPLAAAYEPVGERERQDDGPSEPTQNDMLIAMDWEAVDAAEDRAPEIERGGAAAHAAGGGSKRDPTGDGVRPIAPIADDVDFRMVPLGYPPDPFSSTGSYRAHKAGFALPPQDRLERGDYFRLWIPAAEHRTPDRVAVLQLEVPRRLAWDKGRTAAALERQLPTLKALALTETFTVEPMGPGAHVRIEIPAAAVDALDRIREEARQYRPPGLGLASRDDLGEWTLQRGSWISSSMTADDVHTLRELTAHYAPERVVGLLAYGYHVRGLDDAALAFGRAAFDISPTHGLTHPEHVSDHDANRACEIAGRYDPLALGVRLHDRFRDDGLRFAAECMEAALDRIGGVLGRDLADLADGLCR